MREERKTRSLTLVVMKKITKRNTQGREKERKENTRGKVVSLKGKKKYFVV